MIWGCILAAGYEELHLVEESWKRGSTFRYCREYNLGALKTLELKKLIQFFSRTMTLSTLPNLLPTVSLLAPPVAIEQPRYESHGTCMD